MNIEDFAAWLQERRLDLHWSWTQQREVCLTAIRDKRVWNGTAPKVGDAIQLLKAAVESSW